MSAYIYTIHDAYVGSTKNVNKRFTSHKLSLTNPKNKDYNRKLYQYMRENGLEIEMNVIDTCPIDEQYIREQYWMDKLQLEYNDIRAYSTPEQKKAQLKEWFLENRVRHNAYVNTPVTCECGVISCRGSIATHRTPSGPLWR